ncbi:MAG: hypothetical protein V3T29_09675 [Alphaproteobacteria bacterium]
MSQLEVHRIPVLQDHPVYLAHAAAHDAAGDATGDATLVVDPGSPGR